MDHLLFTITRTASLHKMVRKIHPADAQENLSDFLRPENAKRFLGDHLLFIIFIDSKITI